MTKPVLTAAFGCAILFAGAFPSLAAVGLRGASPTSQSAGPTNPNSNSGPDITVLCDGRCLPPAPRRVQIADPQPQPCNNLRDRWGYYGPYYVRISTKCDLDY